MSNKTRGELRGAIFNSENMKPKSVVVKFFGEDVEVRQPSMDTILAYRASVKEDQKEALVQMLISYVYVPGTNERVFEKADKDNLMQMPFGADFTRLQTTISQLTDVNVQTIESSKNSSGTVSSTT